MIPNLYTSFYGVFGNKPLKKELPRILKLITDESIRKNLKTSLINYTVRRAAIQKIPLDYKFFEKLFIKITADRKEKWEYIDYGECCFAFAYYFYAYGVHQKKALKYLKESILYPNDNAHLYSRYILLSHFYFYGFGVKRNIDQSMMSVDAASRIYYKEGHGVIECNLKINHRN